MCVCVGTHRLSINSLHWFAVAVQAAVDVGGVLPIKPSPQVAELLDEHDNPTNNLHLQTLPVQVIGSLVEEGVILSDKLSPDQLGTWLLHHHFFGQLEICVEETSV